MKRILLAAAIFSLLPLLAPADDPKGGPPQFKELKYRSIGPAAGGRTCRSVGIPGDPLVYYTATASGGLWKSVDGGITWKPIFDDQIDSSVGSIAVAPSDPNIIYVGGGEANIRGNVTAGYGIYKSLDAGKTWKHIWHQYGQIGKIIVHPTNPGIAYAAVLGSAFGPNKERGVFRTKDGGQTWQQILYKDENSGATDLTFDPSNSHILFAALYQVRRRPWELTSGGPASGLYRSADGGDTWKQLGGSGVDKDKLNGLPEGIYGRVGVAVSASDPQRIYALIEAEKGGLYRSDDGGEKWEHINPARYLTQRCWYFGTVHVDPQHADVVYCPNVRLLKSIDGGKSFQQLKGPHHVDHHDLWIDPTNPKRMIDSNDGGVDITTSGGATWFAPPLPISQFYHVDVDNRVPYHVMGNMQDLGTASGPSNSLNAGGIRMCDWQGVGGGETGFSKPDPSDPNIVYAGEYMGYLSRFDRRSQQARNVAIYPVTGSGHGAGDMRYRFQWTAPILISPHDAKVVYHAANVLFRTADGGQSWDKISPDLTRDDKSKQQWSGGPITGDNTGAEWYGTIFAVAESPRLKGVLYAGSDDGLVHVSRDNGKTWTNVTKNIPGLPEWGTVRCIEPSRFADGTAYLVVDAHRLDNRLPYLWKTTDFGQTWQSLSDGISKAYAHTIRQDVYLHVVREDQKKAGLLFVGSERGVIYSADDGKTWQELRLNLPTVAVHDLQVKDDDLVVGTNGRSIWIFDDLTPIRELSPNNADVQLFPPRPAIRWHYQSPIYSMEDRYGGENPPNGAIINYFLNAKPKGAIKLEILDAGGKVIDSISSEKEEEETPPGDPDGPDEPAKPRVLGTEPGVNRVAWDLRYKGPELIKKAKSDWGDAKRGPLVVPDRYTLRLSVDGNTAAATLQVLPDPRSPVTAAVLAEQVKTALTVGDDISRLTKLVHQLRSIRDQLKQRSELLKDNANVEAWRKAAKELIAKLDDLEEKLHNPKAQVTYDILAMKGGAKLYSQLIALYGFIHEGDGPVTQGMREVYTEHQQALARLTAEYAKLLEETKSINELGKKLEVPGVIVP